MLHPSLHLIDPSPARGSHDAPPEPTDPVVHATLADRPLVVVVVLLAGCACGRVIASVVAARGHDRRPMHALGIAFGPLLAGFALASLRWRERAASAVVLRQPRPLGGSQRVLVALRERPADAADALPALRSIGDLGSVTIGWPVSFDDADDPAGEGPARDEAVALLEQAALFLGDLGPGLALLPGRFEDAVRRHLSSGAADVVVLPGDHRGHAALYRDRGLRTVTMVRGTAP